LAPVLVDLIKDHYARNRKEVAILFSFLRDDILSISDFFFWGFVSGLVGYGVYLMMDYKKQMTIDNRMLMHPLGLILNGLMAGLFAIVFDHSIERSILIGALFIFIFPGLLELIKSGKIKAVIEKIILDIFTS